ncbi:hypothetical protein B0I35DRAFT_60642 [Stachybotrys elegans]|uniref:Uncharacterized protein n=1 Tax=Stachybotrys elegans TaxID=80388 RepID=A0A8K0SRC4_9HYPO|nr:hypothetical protein B0I35DRAFT_60642 [Stachybotrys elegans]
MILQEVAASSGDPVITCGHQITPFQALKALWILMKSKIDREPWLRWKHNELDNMFELRCRARDQETEGRDSAGVARDLLYFLEETNAFNCTEPHDHIYAILGFLGEKGLPPELTRNYNLPFHRVYHEYTRFIIQGTQSLNILHSSGTGFLEDHPPSWNLDFRNTSISMSTHHDTNQSALDYKDITFSADRYHLNLNGLILGSIEEVSLPSNPRYAQISQVVPEIEKFGLAAQTLQNFHGAIIQSFDHA